MPVKTAGVTSPVPGTPIPDRVVRRSTPPPTGSPAGEVQPVERDLLAEMTRRMEFEKARADNLEVALRTNRRIGVAVGLVMAEYRLGEDAAFAVLVRLSQAANRKLRDVADDLVALHPTSGVTDRIDRDEEKGHRSWPKTDATASSR